MMDSVSPKTMMLMLHNDENLIGIVDKYLHTYVKLILYILPKAKYQIKCHFFRHLSNEIMNEIKLRQEQRIMRLIKLGQLILRR